MNRCRACRHRVEQQIASRLARAGISSSHHAQIRAVELTDALLTERDDASRTTAALGELMRELGS